MYCKLLPRGEEDRLNKNIIAIGIKNNRIYFIYSKDFIKLCSRPKILKNIRMILNLIIILN